MTRWFQRVPDRPRRNLTLVRLALASLLVSLLLAGCKKASPTPPSSTEDSPASPSPSPAPTPAPTGFTIRLPIRPDDSRNDAFGLNPFGVHIGDHGIDGHPGLDFEYAAGAMVLAAADGTIQSVMPSEGGTAFAIQVQHTFNGTTAYRTDYGVASLAPAIAAGAPVVAGQPLGPAGVFTRTIGRVTVTYGFTHFQLDDFSRNEGLTNPFAVSPEAFFNSAARQMLEAIWRDAFYPQEFVEPFLSNPRDVMFPMTRAWILQAGGLSARLEFTRDGPFASGFSYVMRDSSGAVAESGSVEIEALAKPLSTIDFVPNGLNRRRGVYSILGETMQLDYGAPGAARPSSLAGASTYTSAR